MMTYVQGCIVAKNGGKKGRRVDGNGDGGKSPESEEHVSGYDVTDEILETLKNDLKQAVVHEFLGLTGTDEEVKGI